MRTQSYRYLGFVIESELPLAVSPAPVSAPAELSVTLCSGSPPVVGSDAELIALRRGAAPYEAWRTGRGFVLQIGDAATLVVQPSLTEATVYPREVSDEVLSLLVMGLGFAFWLGLRGELVLHASATVGADGRAVIAPGASGAGKSTLAGLLCACGRTLLADDAVRVARSGSEWLAHGGARELRLRADAGRMNELFGRAPTRRSADGRWALAPPATADGCGTLQHLVFPRIRPTLEPHAKRLTPAAALVELLRGMRFGAWLAGGVQENQVRGLAELARTVPAYEVSLPRAAALDFERARQAHDWTVGLGPGDDEASRELRSHP